MQVTVKTLDSETRVFTVSDEATVEEFKKQITSDVGIPAERQRLIFKGKVLQDSSKLQSYGVDGCVIHLVERKPPTQRTHPDGASSDRPSHDGHQSGDGSGFNVTPDVMNLSQQIVQGLISQLGLNSAQANVSTSQSGDGSTLNVHINLLASANAAHDAGVRVARARQFLRAGRASLNRSEGDTSVLPESTVDMDTSPTATDSQPNGSTTQQPNTDSNTNQNNSPDVLADVLGELLELNSTVRPYLQRYITLLNSNSAENLLPSDDSLPDRVAEALHNISHAYHALSDLTFNFRSPEPRRLNVLPSLSNHVGATPFLSSLLSGSQPPTSTPSGQQPSQQTSSDPRIHVVPGSAIAFTSIISGSLPPSGIYNQQPSATTTGGANRTGGSSMFSFSFGSTGNPGNPGNTQQSTSSTTNTSSTRTSSQNSTQGTEGRDNVRIVMDDFVALFSNAQPVTSHSETSRTATTTPSQQHSQGDTDTQTQHSGTTAASRAVPRINIGSLPGSSNHLDPLVPCESFHFGPRSRQPQGTQTESNAGETNTANGLAQAFSDAIASALQGAMSGRMSEGGPVGPEQPSAPQQPGNTTTTNNANPTTSPANISGHVNPLEQVLSALQSEGLGQQSTTSSSPSSHAPTQRGSDGPRGIEMLQSAILNTLGQAVAGEHDPHPQTIHDFLNEVDDAVGRTDNDEPELQGPYLGRLIDRFGRTMSLQDLTFMMMGLPEPYALIRDAVQQYVLTDLLNGAPATDENIRRVSSDITTELLDVAGELLLRFDHVEGIDIVASVGALLEDAIQTGLKMSRDLDEATFAAQFPDHVRQSTTDLCILFTMCFEDGLRGASHFVGMRLPWELTEDLNERMLQTFQATAIRYVEASYRFRPQREEILKKYMKSEKSESDSASNEAQQDQAEACEVNSQKSEDSDSFATPPLSMSVNDTEEYTPLEDQEDVEMVKEAAEEWKTVVPEDWVPIIARDVIRQRRLPQQAPFSDAYISGLPPKRRKTTDQRAVSSTSENMSSILRQAVIAAGVTPKTSIEALATDARKSDDLHEAYRDEVKKAVKQRTSKDTDYNAETFPATKHYLEKS